MQLIEFFIWHNIYSKFYNKLFSIIGTFLIFLQPVFSIMILSDKKVRNILLTVYFILTIPYLIYKYSTKNIHSVISVRGHLRWKFFELTPYVLIIWLFFLLFSFVYERKGFGIAIGIILLVISYYNYKSDHTMGSMWCWMINSVMIYYAVYLLLYLPFHEEKNIC